MENLNMHRVAAKFVQRLLTDEQKEQRVAICQELLLRANDEENLLKNSVTGNEAWNFFYITLKWKDSPHSGYGNLPRDPKQHAKFAQS